MTNTKYSVARDHNKHFVTLEGDKQPIGYVIYAYGHGWQAIDANDKVVGEKLKGKDNAITHLIKTYEAKGHKTWKASEPSATTERPKAKTEREAAPEAQQRPDFTPEEMYGTQMAPEPSPVDAVRAVKSSFQANAKPSAQAIVDFPNSRLSRIEWTATVTRSNGMSVQYKHERLSQLIAAVQDAEGDINVMLPDGAPFKL